jgi:hypothetical protein
MYDGCFPIFFDAISTNALCCLASMAQYGRWTRLLQSTHRCAFWSNWRSFSFQSVRLFCINFFFRKKQCFHWLISAPLPSPRGQQGGSEGPRADCGGRRRGRPAGRGERHAGLYRHQVRPQPPFSPSGDGGTSQCIVMHCHNGAALMAAARRWGRGRTSCARPPRTTAPRCPGTSRGCTPRLVCHTRLAVRGAGVERPKPAMCY